jgi:hypothetical protein
MSIEMIAVRFTLSFRQAAMVHADGSDVALIATLSMCITVRNLTHLIQHVVPIVNPFEAQRALQAHVNLFEPSSWNRPGGSLCALTSLLFALNLTLT